MAKTINLTDRDVDYIARVVDTEVPRDIQRRSPETYNAMVRAVVDTVTNRMASDAFPKSTTGVLNAKRQFSKITGPKNLTPYGSVQKTPKAAKATEDLVRQHIENRVAGADSTIGNAVNYANPNYSSPSNLRSWINPMIEAGAKKLGIGRQVHWHGNAPGAVPADEYSVSLNGVNNAGALSRVPTPQFADRAGTGLNQADSATGIMSALNPATPMRVDRGLLSKAVAERGTTPGAAASGLLSYSGPDDMASLQARANLGRQQLEMKNGSLNLSEAQTSAAMKRRDAALGVLNANPVAAINAVSPLTTASVTPKTSLASAYGQMADTMAQAGVLGLSGQKVLDPADVLGVGKLAAAPGALAVESMPAVNATVAGPATSEAIATQPQTVARRSSQPVGLLSEAEAGMVGNQKARLEAMGENRKAQIGAAMKKGLGAFGGGVVGGLLAGPIGAVVGGLLGNQIVTPGGILSGTGTKAFPAAPKGPSFGDGKQTNYGKSVSQSSGQYRSAVSKGSAGLY